MSRVVWRNSPRNRRYRLRPLAHGRLEDDVDVLVLLSEVARQLGKVFLEMPARAEEDRHHPEPAQALGVKRSHALGKRRVHELEEGERDALAGDAFGEL